MFHEHRLIVRSRARRKAEAVNARPRPRLSPDVGTKYLRRMVEASKIVKNIGDPDSEL